VDVQQVIKALVFETIHKPLLTMPFFWDMILGKWFPTFQGIICLPLQRLFLRILEDECKVLLHNITNALN
jgi:hypothetical protein